MTNPSSKIINTKYIGIELTQNKIAVIDSDQYHKIQHIKNWYAHTTDDINFYAKSDYKGENICLHNLIMDHIPNESNSELTVDHKNRQTLFNSNINLRIVPQSYQIINQGCRWNNESIFRGVCRHKGHWVSSWVENNKDQYQRFSIKQYGEDRAYELAVEYRLLKEIFIPEYVEALCLYEKLYYFDFENIYDNPDITIIFKDGLQSNNKSGKENFREIKELNKPTKYQVKYYNEYDKLTQITFTEKEEETKPVYKQAIDFQNTVKKKPKLAQKLLNNILRSNNTSGKENITFIRNLNKPTKYRIRYYNEFGKRTMSTFIETNEETKPVYKQVIDFQKMSKKKPKFAWKLLNNMLRSNNIKAEENISFIRNLNKPTKYRLRYFNEFGKRKMSTFTETNEESKPIYKEMIDFQKKMLKNHPKTKRELEKKISNKKELHKKLLSKILYKKNVKIK